MVCSYYLLYEETMSDTVMHSDIMVRKQRITHVSESFIPILDYSTDDEITGNDIFYLKQRKYGQKKFSWICRDSTREEDNNVWKRLM